MPKQEIVNRAINAASTAAHEVVLEYAHQFDKREDYRPLEELAHLVSRTVVFTATNVLQREADNGS
jgi:hypothetical protein